MELSRRSFLKRGLILGTTPVAAGLASTAAMAASSTKKPYKLANVQEYFNICCYCAGGCGTIVSNRNGELINIEGDPDHPVNLGGLCPKGATLWGLRQVVTPDRKVKPNPNRFLYPMVRRPGSKEWERISWDEAFDGIARHVKKTRDETFVQTEDGYTVNRAEGFAFLGGSQINNEECWLLQKFCRTLGSIAIDNQTRVCHSSTVAGLGPSFGRGSMTSHWCDFANADVILTAGSNNVENHPLSSRWVQRAQDKGATWIVIDPRFTRSAKNADIYGRIRPGTDIAFWGGLISYIINNKLYQEEYVLNYTNAACILTKDYDFDPKTGLFTGFDEASKSYSAESWGYDVERFEQWDTTPTGKYAWVKKPGTPNFVPPELEILKRDMTLENPLCVLNVMKRHYDRYTPEMVAKVTGMDPDVMMKIWQVYAGTGKPGKAGALLYALGQTQHTYGGQNCRAMSIIQLLLGNIGVPGGGLNAMRGEPNVQGATDVACTVPDLPGYLKWPTAKKHRHLADYLHAETYADGYYSNKPKFMVSFLKEFFGENATVENDYGYEMLPKIGPRLPASAWTTMGTFHMMRDGRIKGYFAWGMNPAHSTPNAKFARNAMANLDMA